MHRLLNMFRILVGFSAVALFLAMPAAAWQSHDAVHAGSPVAVDDYHHHEDGRIIVHDTGAPADQDRDDGGHDHMPSLLAGMNATMPAAIALPPYTASRLAAAPLPVSMRPEISDPPPARPPRAG